MSAIRMTALYSANTSIILNHMLPCAAFCQLYYYSQPYMALCCILSSLVPFSTICCPVLHSAKSSTILNHMLPCHVSPRLKSSCLHAEFHQHYYHDWPQNALLWQCTSCVQVIQVLHSINNNTITYYMVRYCCSACSQLNYMLHSVSVHKIILKLTYHNLQLTVVSRLKDTC